MEVLMPGATAAGTGASFFIPVTSFNGVSQLTNNYDIDGAAMNDYMHGSAAANFPQSENVQEFSVASALPDASVGRGAGGQIRNSNNQERYEPIPRTILELSPEWRLERELLVEQIPGRYAPAVPPGVVRWQHWWSHLDSETIQRERKDILLSVV